MRIFFLIGSMLSACLLLHGQELKTKKITGQYFTEVFQFEKKSKQKLGTYLKIQTLTKDTLVIGQYLNDSITGVWTYFDSENQEYMKYDYSNDSCIWISELANKADTFPVRLRNNFGFVKLDRPPLFLGFSKEPEMEFISNIKIPVTDMEKERSFLFLANFVINKSGEIIEVETDEIDNAQIRLAVEKTFQENRWKYLPGLLAGKPVDTKIYLLFDIGPTGKEQKTPEKAYVKKISIHYFGIKTTRVVTTRVVSSPSSNNFRGNMPSNSRNIGF